MVNKKSLATFVRTVGNQVISGFKHFLNNVKIGGDLIIDPNSLGAPATNVLTVDGSGVVKTATAFSGISVDSVSKVKHEVKAGVAINKGQAVYVTGADGTNMIVGLASNATEATSSKTMGLLESTVAINGKTNVITEGLLSGLDTSMASAGDVVWLGTGGNLLYGLANKPYAPAHLVFIGIVTRSNSNNGEIFVKVQNGFELNEIHDVDLKTTVPVNGHILGFDGTLWVNKTIAGWLGYTPANAANESNWNAAYNDKINSAAVTGTTTKTLTLTQQDGGTITASWTDINTDAVTSVFGRTGAVVATSGDYTTAQVTESGNLYFTNARGIGSTLTGYASGAGVISSADTILSAIQKLNGNIGALVTGVSSVNGLSGAVTLTTTNIAEGTNLYYTEARVNANTNVAANTAARHNAVTIGTANGLSLSTQVLSLGLASASTNGALSSTDWTTFNSKQAALNGTGFVKITGTTISYDNSTYYLASNPNGYTSNVGTVTSITATAGTGISISGSPITTSGTLTITNTAPDQTVVLTSGTGISVTGTYPNFTITNSSPSSGGTVTSIATTAPITGGTITSTGTIGITQAGASTDGYLSSTDWNTFNNKQPALTNPITGTGTTNYLPKFTGTTTLGNSQIFDNGTNVGIGTATPTNKFQIGSISGYNGNAFAIGNGTDQFAIFQASSFTQFYTNGGFLFATGNTESVRITSTGNVGIGTTSPGYKLEVSGTVYINGDGDLLFDGSTGGDGFQMDYYNGQMYFGNKLGTNWHMVMKDNGNVGIGTTSPDSKLHISTTSSNPFRMVRTGGAATNFGYEFGNGAIGLYDYTNSSYRYYITSGGNVGIGTTSPSVSLEANGVIRSTRIGAASQYVEINGGDAVGPFITAAGAAKVLTIQNNSTTNSEIWFNQAVASHYLWLQAGTEKMRLNSSGNLGIGTTSPAHKLSVVGQGTGIAHIGDAGFGSGNYVGASFNGTLSTTNYNFLSSPTDSHLYINRPAGNGIRFREANVEQMTILAGGNVGIGAGFPLRKLHVVGDFAVNAGTGQYYGVLVNGGEGSNPNVLIGDWHNASANLTWDSTNKLLRIDAQYSTSGAPIVFSGNDAAIEYGRFTSTGNLGIGTTSPTAKLNIVHTASTTVPALQLASSGSLANNDIVRFQVNGLTNGFRMFQDASSVLNYTFQDGNVGIGTTSPWSRFTVSGALSASTSQISIVNTEGGHSIIRAGISGVSNNGMSFVTANVDGSSQNVRMVVGASGNVGIGTTSPSHKLQVVTNAVAGKQNMAAIDRTAGNLIRFTNPQYSTDASMGLLLRVFPDSDARQGAGIIASGGANNATTDLDLFVTTSPDGLGGTSYSAVKINGLNGNVGIGTTSPSAKLQVGGSTKITGGDWPTANAGLEFNYVGNTSYIGSYDRTNSVYKGLFLFADNMTFETGASIRMYITSGGNVGIGTTSPGSKLEVYDATNPKIYISGGGLSSKAFVSAYAGNFDIGTEGSNPVTFYTNAIERVRIMPTGSVGINTTNPAYKLDVIGSVRSYGGLYSNGYHADTFIENLLPAANNGAGTGDVQLRMWCSEPGVTWDWAGFGYNVRNDNGSPGGFGRVNTAFGQSYMRFATTGDWYFYNTNTSGTRTTTMTLSSGGNVGIGTTSPGYKLTVSGDIYSSNVIRIAGTNPFYFEDYGGGWFMQDSSYLRTYNQKSIWTGDGFLASQGGLSVGYGGATPPFQGAIINANVGIGTSLPSYKLQVYSGAASANTIAFQVLDSANAISYVPYVSSGGYNTASVNGGSALFNTAGSDWWVGNQNGSALRFSGNTSLLFYANSTAQGIWNSTGLGIGTTSPSAKLHVIGNVTVSATLSTANAKISGTLADSFNQVGTAGQVLSSTGTGIEWVTGGGGGGTTITVKDEGTTVSSSISTLDFVGSNVQATASGSTATVAIRDNVGTGSQYLNASTTNYAIPGSYTDTVQIDGTDIIVAAPNSPKATETVIAILTFGILNVVNSDAFNAFYFRLYNASTATPITDTEHRWSSYMSANEPTTVATFHIPIKTNEFAQGDNIYVQCQTSVLDAPEIYYCALTFIKGTN